MSFSIRLSAEEKSLVESYAKLHSMSLSEAFKKALFEKIEDEYDVAVAQEACEEYIKSGEKSRPISELWKELDL
jgi:predicted DNA-binding protein